VTRTISLDPQSFAYWNDASDSWTTPKGTVQLYLGDSTASAPPVGSIVIR